MANKKIFKIILLIIGIIFSIFVIFFKPECIIKKILKLPCPTCGMTRAFYLLFKGNILSAIKMNILSIPIFILIVLFVFSLIIDIIFNKNCSNKLYAFFVKHYKLVILILIINWILNIVNVLYFS